MPFRTINRRDALKQCVSGILPLALPRWGMEALIADDLPVINIDNDYRRGQWYFDPVGVYIGKGETLRWQASEPGATVTAFHPSNGNHELRIPEAARPFDSGVLGDMRKNTFAWTFDVEGTYDYYSRYHEVLGMVGRIVVGSPGGPAEMNPPGYGGRDGRAVFYPAAAKLLESTPSRMIVEKKVLPYPRYLLIRPIPYG